MSRSGRRGDQSNPRALGTNPRARGTNPRATGRRPVWNVAHLRAMPYAKYLKTAYWEHLRKLVYERAEGRCDRCGVASPWLQAHHKTYVRRGCERLEDLERRMVLNHDMIAFVVSCRSRARGPCGHAPRAADRR